MSFRKPFLDLSTGLQPRSDASLAQSTALRKALLLVLLTVAALLPGAPARAQDESSSSASVQPTATNQKLFLPMIAGGASSTTSDQTGDATHSLDDYVLAERARQRNEPPFVAPSTAAATGPLNVVGRWDAPVTWPFVFASAASLPDGRIIAWGGNNTTSFSGGNYTYSAVWNPSTGQFLSTPNTNHSMFCGIPTTQEDGRVIVNGGDGNNPHTSVFDYRTNQWQRIDEMVNGRWYPGSVALPNGQIFTGLGEGGGQYPEIWSPGQGWSLLNGANLQTPILNYTGYQSNWLPYFHLTANGQIFHSGPTQQMNWINPTGNGSITAAGLTNTWYPKYSTVVMYDEGKLLMAGGAVDNTSTAVGTNKAATIDLTGATPRMTAIASMTYARKFNNNVILPTGEVIIIGGNTSGTEFSDSGTILTPEIWNPDTKAWRSVADMSVPRNYHSVALLMQDGRIWSGGGGLCACSADHPDAQIYSPPYLFNADGSLATRPTISSAPAVAVVGQRINVQATAGLQKFSLIKITAETHHQNSDLRYLRPAFVEQSSGQYQVTLHSNQNVLTPGYWMLFGVNSQGVPSVAKVIQIVHNAIVITNPGAQSSIQGASVNLPMVARDVNGAALTYSATGLPAGLTINSTSGVITGIPSAAGNYVTTVAIVNNTGGSNSATFNWSVQYVGNGNGQILRQWWTGITGIAVTNLTSNANYPNNPAGSDMLTSFEAPSNWADNYGTRIRGYLYPPVTGQYTFWIASDDNSQLLLSTDATPTRATAIASVPDWTNAREWTKFAQQKSVAITLQAGQKYYIEALQKEGTGGDNLAVAWQIPGGAQEVIAGRYLAPYVPDQAYRYVKLEALSEVNGNPWTSAAEFNVLDSTGTPLNRSGWAITADSQELQGENGSVANAIDGNANTIWHTQWQAASPPPPHWLIADLRTPTLLTGFRYLPRQDGPNGRIANYKFYLSQDGVNWSTLVAQGTFPNSATEQTVFFRTPQAAALVLDPLASPPKQVNTAIAYTVSYRNGTNPRFKWLFGDGAAETAYSASPSSSHTYSQPGLYAVKVTATDDSNVVQTMTFMQAVYLTPTTNRPTLSMNLAYETRASGNSRLWVVNPDNDTVSVFDTVTNGKLAEIAVGKAPRALAIAPNGRVWVTNKGAATLSIIDPSTLAVVQTVNLPYASQPFGVAFAPTGNAAYITLEASGKLLRFDPGTAAQTGSLDVGANVRHLAINSTGSKVYVSRFITPRVPGEETAAPQMNSGGGEVVLVDAASFSVSKTILLRSSDKADTEVQGRGVPNYLGPVVIAPDGINSWTPAKQDDIFRGTLRDGNNLTFQNTVRAINSRIDLTTDTEDYASRMDHDNASVPSTALFDKSGNYLFVALETNRQVVVVDAYGKRELFRIDVGRAPQGLALSADGLKLYVNNFMDRAVSVIDISKIVNEGKNVATLLTTYNTVTTEKLTAQVLTGKQFFYDAKDTRLARDSYMSCATCHNDGGHDGRVWDLTGMGEGLRNTIALNGRAGMGQGFLHWSGNFDEVQDFEGQIRALAGGTGLMADADFTATQNTLGPAKAGKSADLDALAAYVGSLRTFAQSPYRNADGTLTADALAGKTLFQNLNCAQCHTGASFTDSSNNVLRNIGTIKPSSGKRLNGTLTGIDTPTLRDVWLTAPYLHDGSAATLAAAVRAHQGVSITDSDLTKLVAFLQQIGSEEAQAPVNGGSGQILRQWWTGITGSLVTDLTGNANYPNTPSGSNQLTSFEAPTGWADNYGTRIRGYLTPPITGSYIFWIASDDYGQLLLSTDANPANARPIANVPGWTNSREWTKFSQQQSAAILLQAGQKYYIEALQKEGTGGDNLAVAWQIPGSTQAVITGAYLSPYQPPVVTNVAQGKTASQSSTGFGGLPTRAADGNTNGIYNNNSVSHTGNEANPWWQVDLGGSYQIDNLQLWNRTDCCSDRLSNFYVFVSNTDMTGRTFSSLVGDSTIWRYQVTGQAPAKLDIPAYVSGRYVRVQLAGTNYLSLAEVQVFGVAGSSSNISVPNVVGATQTAAQQTLTTAGLGVGAVTRAYHPTVAAGNVISQTPTAGSTVPVNTLINLAVSNGPAPVSPATAITFTAKLDFSTNGGPTDVLSRDLDGDGKADLVTANYGPVGTNGSTVSILRNTSASGSVTFAAKADITVSEGPHELADGDIDGDGKTDVVIGHYGAYAGGNTVSILRNTSTSGAITFAAKVDLTVNSGPMGVAIGDLDGDGKPDLAVAQFNDGSGNTISVLRNTSAGGTISFAPKIDVSAGVGPYAIRIGDIDGDGKADLVVTNFGTFAGDGNTVSILRNTSTTGNLSFAAKVDFTTNSGPRDFVIADIDGDGKPDVTIAHFGGSGAGNTVSVLRNTSTLGNPTFAAKVTFTVGTGAIRIALNDLDKDGKLDVATANFGTTTTGGAGNTVSVLRNTSTSGNVTFASKVDFTVGTGPHGLASTDLNGDGWPELITANYGTISGEGNTVSVLRNLNTAATSLVPNVVGATQTAAQQTLTGAGFTLGAVTQVYNSSVPAGAVISQTPTAGTSLVSGSPVALVVSLGVAPAVTVPNVVGATQTAAQQTLASANLAVGPITRVYHATVPSGSVVSQNPAAGSSTAAGSAVNLTVSSGPAPTNPPLDAAAFATKADFTVNAGPIGLVSGDLDGDGKPDLAVANYGTGSGNTVSVLRNTSTSGSASFAAKVDLTTNAGPYELALGDLDGDGKLDLAVANYGGSGTGSTVSVLRNTSTSGAITFAAKVDFATNSGSLGIAIGDVDGDGKPDLAVTRFSEGAGTVVSVLRNTSTSGAISFAAKADFTVGVGPIGVALGDLDGDGKAELVVSNYGTFAGDGATVSVLRNTSTSGSISFATKADFATNSGPRGVVIGDVDGDGKADVLVANFGNSSGSTVSVLRNTGTTGNLAFAAKVDLTVGSGALGIALRDLNKDGKADIAVSNFSSGTLSLLQNNSTSGNVAFTAKFDFASGANAFEPVISDLDGDSWPDVAVTAYGGGVNNTVAVLRNLLGTPH